MGLSYFHISTLPRLHHIVWCCLPEEDGSPGKTVRPALVRETMRNVKNGRGAILVSYGTTRLNSNECQHVDLIIQNAEQLARLELPMAVRFDLGLTNWLPWAAEFFKPPEHSMYVVAGPLSETQKQRLREKLKRRGIIQAL